MALPLTYAEVRKKSQAKSDLKDKGRRVVLGLTFFFLSYQERSKGHLVKQGRESSDELNSYESFWSPGLVA